MGKLKDFKDTFLEVLWITKSTLGTFWFWFPILYMGFVIFQLFLMFYVHPLTLAIVPVILILYGIKLENKRVRRRWGIKKIKRISSSKGVGASPEPVGEFEWKVDQAVDQYEKLLKNKDKEKE